jgi:hypothetical protein
MSGIDCPEVVMLQTVRTVIKWKDADGCILGAIREQEIDLPKWGKRHFLREEINRTIVNLCWEHSQIAGLNGFRDYAMKSFNPSQIVLIKSRTKGSYISFKDEALKRFMETNKLI